MNSADLCTELGQPYANFSNYSLLLGYAGELEFWDPEVIPEDFHIIYRAMLYSRGALSVCRVWSVISNDTVVGLRDRYVQAKRHAWGVTNIAWILAVLREAPFTVDRLWLRLLRFYVEEMQESLTPSW